MNHSKMIVFVCTGNTCRSPMAEALFKKLLSEKQLKNLEVKSRGLAAACGDEASFLSIEVMKEKGIDISAHRSMPLNLYDADEATLVVCMTESHRLALLRAGVADSKIYVLGVPDPFGGDIDTYRECADKIEKALISVLECLESIVKIVPLTLEMAEEAAQTEKVALGVEGWTADGIKETLSLNGHYFAALSGERMVGHGGMTAVAGEGYITNIAVLPSYRRRGIASRLTEALLQYALQNELEFVSLEVRESNLAAIALYHKHGFTVRGKRKNFYSGPKEDALIMTVDLK